MTIIFSDPIFQKHETGAHPECPERLASIATMLESAPEFQACRQGVVTKPDMNWLENVHAARQILAAERISAAGGGNLDPDTILSARSYEIALKACGTSCAAIDAVVKDPAENALCLIRPPGHHATATKSMGFCIFNNIAVAAQYALTSHQVNRILIIDWDVHHGNGTQDIFYESDQVMFYSIHRFPFYPGTGHKTDTGTGKGLGYTRNTPIEFGTLRQQFLDSFAKGIHQAAAKIKPELILISAGFDAHHLDPVGSLGLHSNDYLTMTNLVKQVAGTYAKGRIASFLEGGYNLPALAESVHFHLRGLNSSLASP